MMGEYMHVFATVLIYVEVYHIGLLLYSQKNNDTLNYFILNFTVIDYFVVYPTLLAIYN